MNHVLSLFLVFILLGCAASTSNTATQTDAPRAAVSATVTTAPGLGTVTPPVYAGTPEAIAIAVFGAIVTKDVVTLKQLTKDATGPGDITEEIERWRLISTDYGGAGTIVSTMLSTEQRGATTVVHALLQHQHRARTMDLFLSDASGAWQLIGWDTSYMFYPTSTPRR